MLIYINASLYCIISYVYNFLLGNILISIYIYILYYTYMEVHALVWLVLLYGSNNYYIRYKIELYGTLLTFINTSYPNPKF